MICRRLLLVAAFAAASASEEGCCGSTVNREAATCGDLPSRGTSFAGRVATSQSAGEKGARVRIPAATFRMGTDRPKIMGDGEGPSRLVVRLVESWLQPPRRRSAATSRLTYSRQQMKSLPNLWPLQTT